MVIAQDLYIFVAGLNLRMSYVIPNLSLTLCKGPAGCLLSVGVLNSVVLELKNSYSSPQALVINYYNSSLLTFAC